MKENNQLLELQGRFKYSSTSNAGEHNQVWKSNVRVVRMKEIGTDWPESDAVIYYSRSTQDEVCW